MFSVLAAILTRQRGSKASAPQAHMNLSVQRARELVTKFSLNPKTLNSGHDGVHF